MNLNTIFWLLASSDKCGLGDVKSHIWFTPSLGHGLSLAVRTCLYVSLSQSVKVYVKVFPGSLYDEKADKYGEARGVADGNGLRVVFQGRGTQPWEGLVT